jgi:hypothetical protein
MPSFAPIINKSKPAHFNKCPSFITSEKLANARVNSLKFKGSGNKNSSSIERTPRAEENWTNVNTNSNKNKKRVDKLNISAVDIDNSHLSQSVITYDRISSCVTKPQFSKRNNNYLEKVFDNVNNEATGNNEEINSLYKLNIRNASAWDNNGHENFVFLNPKFSSLVKKIIKS